MTNWHTISVKCRFSSWSRCGIHETKGWARGCVFNLSEPIDTINSSPREPLKTWHRHATHTRSCTHIVVALCWWQDTICHYAPSLCFHFVLFSLPLLLHLSVRVFVFFSCRLHHNHEPFSVCGRWWEFIQVQSGARKVGKNWMHFFNLKWCLIMSSCYHFRSS